MKVLVTGGRGQLGRSLLRVGTRRGDVVHALGSDVLDVTRREQIAEALLVYRPDVVIHAAAFTAVDRAEIERERAFAINHAGAANVASACADADMPLLHVSTDYVFDGSATRPYREDDPVAPINVYGASKAGGERDVIAAGGVVVRTAWLFGAGGPSFVHAILARARVDRELRVVADQRGCPTWSDDLAEALLRLAREPARESVYHACGAEPTTWYGLASAIVEEARRHGALACEHVAPITTADYPTVARRPAYSVLDGARLAALAITVPSWRAGLRRVVADARGGA
ncbi:MAG TPA: dTDP-4-dehydrorhamnose reductase [Kofleriaceae bacterium]|nr:dTDP-4-dehydrorhamnose reductase [Kofleriaceae bacterium]